MECFCDYDGPMPEFYRVDAQQAKKPHKCCECHQEIKPGEWYTTASGKWDGEFATFKTCGFCGRVVHQQQQR